MKRGFLFFSLLMVFGKMLAAPTPSPARLEIYQTNYQKKTQCISKVMEEMHNAETLPEMWLSMTGLPAFESYRDENGITLWEKAILLEKDFRNESHASELLSISFSLEHKMIDMIRMIENQTNFTRVITYLAHNPNNSSYRSELFSDFYPVYQRLYSWNPIMRSVFLKVEVDQAKNIYKKLIAETENATILSKSYLQCLKK